MIETRSLLVIEDDLSLIQFIDVVLNEARPGIQWEYVTSGETALELIRRRSSDKGGAPPYDLVMADVYLDGELTGFDVWRECRKICPAMPFVVATALSRERYATALGGADDRPVFLPKPLTARGCRQVFEEFLA